MQSLMLLRFDFDEILFLHNINPKGFPETYDTNLGRESFSLSSIILIASFISESPGAVGSGVGDTVSVAVGTAVGRLFILAAGWGSGGRGG